MIDKSSIGQIIKKLRKDNNLTQEELAERIDISTNYLSKVERGLCVLNAESFLKMAEVLSFTLEDFGIKSNTSKDSTKAELLKIILSATEKENKAYLKILSAMTEIIS